MTATHLRSRTGASLLELVVVLALLGVLYTIASVSVPIGGGEPDDLTGTLLEARRSAIREHRMVTREWNEAGRRVTVTAFASGLVLADSGRGTFLVTFRGDDAAP